jgi:hypothetical protein
MYGHQETGWSFHLASTSTKNSRYWLRTGSRYSSFSPENCQSTNSATTCPEESGSGLSPSGSVASAAAGSVQNSTATMSPA